MKASLHNIGMGCKTMYLEDYKRWSEADLEDSALKEELETIKGNFPAKPGILLCPEDEY